MTGVVHMEVIVRRATAEAIIQRLLERAPDPAPSGVANLRWGKASEFAAGGLQAVANPVHYSITVEWPDDDDDEPDPVTPVVQFQEKSKTETDERVENPADSEQYVIVRKRTTSAFEGPHPLFWPESPTGSIVLSLTYKND